MAETVDGRPAVAALPALVGQFAHDITEGRWWWSETMYTIYGFRPREVVPSSALMRAHVHPEDVARVRRTFARVLGAGGPYSCYARIVDAQRRTRHVVAVGDGVRAGGDAVIELHGYLVDMTEARRRDAADEAAAAVRGAVRHRAVIEQAKGALMFVYGVDEDTAIAILKTVSQHKNVKLNQLAAELMAAAPSTPTFPAAERSLAALLGDPPAARPFE